MIKNDINKNGRIILNLVCPVCKSSDINLFFKKIKCNNLECASVFPMVDGIPILINESNSIFNISDLKKGKKTTILDYETNKIRRLIRKLIPRLGENFGSKKNYLLLSKLLSEKSKSQKILVIGAGIEGKDFKIIKSLHSVSILNTDVCFGPNTNIICDAHDLPFCDSTFDAVISQAVLEHVVDPYRCAEEIYRVLKIGGLVYSETPFIQQVHMAPYDFTRFTFLGHRRLFRGFKEIDSGVCCGPGMALAWTYQYFLLSFFESKIIRKLIKVFAAYTSFFLSYFDRFLINKSASYDAASAFYFIGTKSRKKLTDKQILKIYKGAGR